MRRHVEGEKDSRLKDKKGSNVETVTADAGLAFSEEFGKKTR